MLIPTEEIFSDYLSSLKTKSEKTYNNYLGILKIYLKFLHRRELIPDIRFLEDYKQINSPKSVYSKKYYSEEVITEFLKIRPRWCHYFLFLAFYLGFRPIEIAKMKLSNLNTEEEFFEITPEIQKNKKINNLAISDGPIKNKLLELLSWRNLQRTKNDFLIVNTRGASIKKELLCKQIVDQLKKIDSEFRLYRCRYTAGWRAYKQTRNIYAAQQLLRHSTTQQTLTYLGIQKEEILRAQRKDMEKIFECVSV